MKMNVGTIDRAIRVVVGLALLALFFVYPGAWWLWITSIVGVILVATGAVGTCPIYMALGMSTRHKE